MRFIVIIPARYASTRFPGKPLADIGGKSMIRRVYERVKADFEDVYVATDDIRIEREVLGFGGNVVMTSTMHQSGTDRCAEALSIVEEATDSVFDVAINVQGDEPFISKEHLDAIKSCFDDPATQIATLIKQFGANEDIFNPNSPKVVVSADDFAIYFSRSVIPFIRSRAPGEWSDQHRFWKHIGLYAYRTDVLRKITRLPQGELEMAESLEQLRWIENGYRVKVARTNVETIAVDTEEDLSKILSLFE